MKDTAEILLFVTEEDVESTRRAKALRAGLEREGWSCRVVNRLSNDLEELKLACKYLAVSLPRWVVMYDGESWRDEHGMPSFNEARKILAKLE